MRHLQQSAPIASDTSAKEQTIPWLAPSWRNFPYLASVCLLVAVLGMASAFLVLYLANDSPIDSWAIAPTVYLSIAATLSNSMLRAAFRSGSDRFWWSQLLSDSGVTLQELHNLWNLAYNPLSLITLDGPSFQPIIRTSGLLVILAAINGPMMQRAVTVELTTRTESRTATLPVRQEPLWNLTTWLAGQTGYIWSGPPYQKEFSEVVIEMNQRQPMTLSSAVCRSNSTCTTRVTVAGFTRSCSESTAPLHGIPSTDVAKYVLFPYPDGRESNLYYCAQTGKFKWTNESSSYSYCNHLETYFQLDVGQLKPSETASGGNSDPRGLPWHNSSLPPGILNYTSYTRRNESSETITIQRCNFSTSFIELPLQISDGNVVTLLPNLIPKSGAHGIESIPTASLRDDDLFLKGITQAMMDKYRGFIIWDNNESSFFIQGSGPRQFIDQSTIKTEGFPGDRGRWQATFSMSDPLEDFTTTLHELSLRYALKSLPDDDPVRLAELDQYMELTPNTDIRAKALNFMQTRFSKTTNATIQESKTVAVYRAQYAYMIVAISVTSVAAILIMVLLRGWSQLGRTFSLAPLEIAKAFNAPLLDSVASNATGDRVANGRLKTLRVRGEAFARMKAAVDTRDEGLDIVIQARTDSYNTHRWEEAIYRANKFLEIGVDLVFIEALPDRDSMIRAVKEVKGPLCANIIEGGLTENMSAKDLAAIGMVTVAYPWTLVAAHLRSTREALESLKKSFSIGKPEQILSYEEVCYGVGFNKYWELEERYKYDANGLTNGGEKEGQNGAGA
ncbi:hypothetical protein CEP54_011367 [Fusarium duplospermum]|uniref:Uncharacterized protein n=1 Tax=Fusarium duplospermum TaxID=1325734 RepID=A0A428PET8_9HYPO|nr:hypothetical protein CEP54_011367 [Fusarium duplospermum]